MDKHFFELTDRNTLLEGIEDTPTSRKLGGKKTEEVPDKIRMYIATNPAPVNIRDFMKANGKDIPPEVELFKSYDVFLLPHSVGIIKEGGWEKVGQVGYRMEFTNDDQSVVLNLLPNASYTRRVGGGFKFEAALGLNGNIEPPLELTNLLDKIEWLGAGGKLQASTEASFVGNISFSVYSTDIQAIGKNGNYSEWQFNKSELPLHGQDIEMNQILLVDRFADTISYRCKAYVNISSWLGNNSIRRETDWVEMKCRIRK